MIDIVKYKPVKVEHPKVLGVAIVSFYGMHLHLEVRITQNEEDIWFKMPTKNLKNNKKINQAHWPTQEQSDEFQTILKEKIRKKYAGLFDKEKLTQKRKNDMGKARKKSKFAK